MKPWERKLFEWGLLGYLVRDVIGARQEEELRHPPEPSHVSERLGCAHPPHFVALIRALRPGARLGRAGMKRLAYPAGSLRSDWRAARLLGGTLAAVCRKGGDAPPNRFDAGYRSSRPLAVPTATELSPRRERDAGLPVRLFGGRRGRSLQRAALGGEGGTYPGDRTT